MRTPLALLVAVLLLGGLLAGPAAASTPDQFRTYVTSGAYERDVAAVDRAAGTYLDSRTGAQRPALVLDVDETSLSNLAYLQDHDFAFDDVLAIAAFDLAGKPTALAPTLALARHAAARGVTVFYVTGRPTPLWAATAANLTRVGYPGVAGHLITRPVVDLLERSVVPYKSTTRAALEALGYDVVADVGDQPSDLAGGHADRTFQLPNPFYSVP